MTIEKSVDTTGYDLCVPQDSTLEDEALELLLIDIPVDPAQQMEDLVSHGLVGDADVSSMEDDQGKVGREITRGSQRASQIYY